MATVLYMSVSVDGYISTPDDFLGGADGNRLHDWYAPGGDPAALTGEAKALAGELDEIGAVVTGRRTTELMDHWGGDVHHGVPIFIPSHRPPGPAARWGYPNVTYVEDITTAVSRATTAAGGRDVYLQGGYTARQALAEGVLDEIQVHLIPVLLGGGHRLFDVLPEQIELEILRVIDTRTPPTCAIGYCGRA